MSGFRLSEAERDYALRVAFVNGGTRSTLAFYAAVLLPMIVFAIYGAVLRDAFAVLVAFVGVLAIVLWMIGRQLSMADTARSLMRKVIEHAPASARECVTHDDAGISHLAPGGKRVCIGWDELDEIRIVTTEEGPAVDDVFWVLRAGAGGLAFPGSTSGMEGLLERLQMLPGFDNDAVIRAMGSTESATFVCWQRPSQPD